jgi:purine nucleosidase
VYVIGDSPLVLLTALRSSFGNDPSSSEYMIQHCPIINDKGSYIFTKPGREIKVFTRVDAQLTFEDFYSKLALFNQLPK